MLYYIQRTLHRVDCVRSGNRRLLRKNDLTMNDGYHIITKQLMNGPVVQRLTCRPVTAKIVSSNLIGVAICSPRQLSRQSNGLKIRVSTVRFCPEAPYMRKQLSGRAPPCQGGGREFESRFPLHFYVAAQPSGKAEVCKTFIPQFDSGCRLHTFPAGVAEQADATDLKSVGWRQPYRFDSGPRHHYRLISVCFFYAQIQWEEN